MKAIVREHTSEKYTPRTYFNAKTADLTLAIAVDLTTAGEKCTHKAAGSKYLGFEVNDKTDPIVIARELYARMNKKKVRTLNIAGNGIYTLSAHGWDQDRINYFLLCVIKKVYMYHKIDCIYTGGQTGVDIAGAVVAEYLGINSVVTLPKGYVQRFENKMDVQMTKEAIERQIQTGVNTLKLAKGNT